jgi:hypothetical protein
MIDLLSYNAAYSTGTSKCWRAGRLAAASAYFSTDFTGKGLSSSQERNGSAPAMVGRMHALCGAVRVRLMGAFVTALPRIVQYVSSLFGWVVPILLARRCRPLGCVSFWSPPEPRLILLTRTPVATFSSTAFFRSNRNNAANEK